MLNYKKHIGIPEYKGKQQCWMINAKKTICGQSRKSNVDTETKIYTHTITYFEWVTGSRYAELVTSGQISIATDIRTNIMM